MAEEKWNGPSRRGVLQVSEARVLLPGWSKPRRVIFGRRCLGVLPKEKLGTFWDETRHEFEAYLTSLAVEEASAWQIVELYRKRADAENVFDELKNQWSFNGFCSRKLSVSELAARLLLQIYASGTWWKELKQGYERLCCWLDQTAPQLEKPPHLLPDFTFLKPNFLTPNCGI